ncbi:hypothetical protein DSO57_1023116 [Entomophthora muscae]|uniref:Uncharacterized protein n=1 Tax=Entomophthora muscae TaxID=34485 RepID=A0ACC2TEG7_9FUNG|nr:hypothetical protein DSO57_1023116 [Entomophthora muscae]
MSKNYHDHDRSSYTSRQKYRSLDSQKPSGWFLKTYSPAKAGTIDGQATFINDRALLKALRAPYKPPADSTDITKQPFATLFVSRLSPSTTEKMIEDEFSKYGKIISVKIVRNIVTGKSCKYGFVEFKHKTDCRAAYKDSRRRMVDGQFILVDYERSRVMKDWKPRRLGSFLNVV